MAAKALVNSLTRAQQDLLRETDRDNLALLDEDGLVELHTRIRRARDKHVGLYRREAASKVATVGGRGKAHAKNTRNRETAEVFEDALARVSRALAAAARASANVLRAERLAMARAARSPRSTAAPGTRRPPAKRGTSSQRSRPTPDQPVLRKQHASSRAMGARRQAKRDSR
ncbi:hypothetical protein HDA40_000229 [Hamadaea flava]|uniref:Uncharacterized protein n=1 Tax=Hamadaea flava TaxID=1742688 RepID=A0ABV8LZ08_9ACTN|nr:hypothetical protein [Hamadaea flava]MCP2321722.1 hypothetical protein [Hamadaea flava]